MIKNPGPEPAARKVLARSSEQPTEVPEEKQAKPLVSVVLIFLNAAKYLHEAIESVFAQTYDNWELLLVDDGSTDAGTDHAMRFAERHAPKIRYLEHAGHENRGKPASRNLGLSQARGKYVGFIDADDVWLPHKLQEQVAILNTHPEAALVYGRDLYWYSWSTENGNGQRDHLPKLGVPSGRAIRPPNLLPLYLLGRAMVPCPTTVLARRASIERTGGFDESFVGANNVYEDQAFYAKFLLQESAMPMDACWSHYRQHPEASCAVDRSTGQSDQTREYFLTWLENHLRQQQIEDPTVWKALRQAQWLLRHPAIARVLRSIRRRLGAVGM